MVWPVLIVPASLRLEPFVLPRPGRAGGGGCAGRLWGPERDVYHMIQHMCVRLSFVSLHRTLAQIENMNRVREMDHRNTPYIRAAPLPGIRGSRRASPDPSPPSGPSGAEAPASAGRGGTRTRTASPRAARRRSRKIAPADRRGPVGNSLAGSAFSQWWQGGGEIGATLGRRRGGAREGGRGVLLEPLDSLLDCRRFVVHLRVGDEVPPRLLVRYGRSRVVPRNI